MQPYRVSILAAGGGTRISRSKSSHKALVRLGDRAVISHIIDLFPQDAAIVVALGFNGHLIRDYLELFYPKREFIFVDVPHWGKGYGPGYSLKACREHLQVPFYTWSCDTVVGSLPREISNWAGYSRIDSDVGSYCTLRIDNSGSITGFFDKSPEGTTAAWIGAGYVRDFEQFWRVMDGNIEVATGELQVTNALFSLDIKAIEFPDWLDTGNEVGLRRALARFGENIMHKPEEEVYFNGPSVIRFFKAPGVAAQKARRAETLGDLTSKVECVRENFYSSEYVPGADLTCIENAHEHIVPLFSFFAEKLWRDAILGPDERVPFEEDCMTFYRTKTLERVALAAQRLDIDDAPYKVNGYSIPSLSALLEEIPWAMLRQGVPSTIHGDLNFSNIIVTKSGSFLLLDQRERFGRFENTGDRYYDFAKCYQSVIWPHVSIRRRNFGVISQRDHELTVEIEIPESLRVSRGLIESWLDQHGYDVWRVRCIGALSLLNSAPLHDPHVGRHLYFWGYWNLADILIGC